MKIVADENIPLVDYYFGSSADIIRKPGRAITQHDLQHADALLVRSITSVDQTLLQNTSVKFVGSTTTGIDHLDINWLEQAGIAWYAATGCNSTAVVEYVICVIAALQKQKLLLQKRPRAAIIGVGSIGKQVAEILQIFNFDILFYDPIRAAIDKNFPHTPWDAIKNVDLICLHTPLTTGGTYPTHHLITAEFLQRQKKDCILLNTGRGAVIKSADLEQFGKYLLWCLDVWEHEPDVDTKIVKQCLLATPHIAGYSIQARDRAVGMVYHAAQRILDLPAKGMAELPHTSLDLQNQPMQWQDILLEILNPVAITKDMQDLLVQANNPAQAFDRLRKNYADRHEFAFIHLKNILVSADEKNLLRRLGFILQD